MKKNLYHAPQFMEMGQLRSFVQTGTTKSGPLFEGVGGGGGEEPMFDPMDNFSNSDFSGRSSSSDSSGGRSGRGN